MSWHAPTVNPFLFQNNVLVVLFLKFLCIEYNLWSSGTIIMKDFNNFFLAQHSVNAMVSDSFPGQFLLNM